MSINVDKKFTGLPIPASQFKENLNDMIRRFESVRMSSLSDLKDRISQLKVDTKREAPKFKIEMWYLFLHDNVLTIRYGHEGEPQITITQSV